MDLIPLQVSHLSGQKECLASSSYTAIKTTRCEETRCCSFHSKMFCNAVYKHHHWAAQAIGHGDGFCGCVVNLIYSRLVHKESGKTNSLFELHYVNLA